MPDEQLVDITEVRLGWKPWRWKTHSLAQADRLAGERATQRLSSLDPLLERYSPEQQQQARHAVRESLVTFWRAYPWLDVLDNRIQLVFAPALLFGVVPVGAIIAFFIGPPLGWLPRLVTIMIAALSTGTFLLVLLLMPEEKSDAIFVGTLLPLPILSSALATAPSWWTGAPTWLVTGPVHLALAAAAWTLAGATLGILAFWFYRSVSNIYFSAMTRRRYPEQFVVNIISSLVHDLPSLSDPKTIFLRETEDASQTIERFWPRSLRTRYPHVNADLTRLARQMAAAAREQQLGVSIGVAKPVDLRDWLVSLLVAVLSRDLAIFRLFNDDISPGATKVVWWRRIGRSTTALALLGLTFFLLLAAIWQPGLPELLRQRGWVELADVLTLNDQVRVAFLAAAVTVPRALVALYQSPPSVYVEGQGARGLGILRRRSP